MKTPIVLTALGSTTTAQQSYTHLENAIQQQFPGQKLYCGFSARVVAAHQKKKEGGPLATPEEILNKLAIEGHQKAIIQSLHLLPGIEFHKLLHQLRQVEGMKCMLGMPLLSSPQDYTELASLLAAALPSGSGQAFLFLGHGSRHPVWTSYPALEYFLRQQLGDHIFVGAIEHYPESDHLEQTILTAGFTKVLIVPLFLVAGLHVQRDIAGDAPHSWYNRLTQRGLAVEIFGKGLAQLPGLEELVIRHIHEAHQQL